MHRLTGPKQNISNIQKKFESCRYLNTDKAETLELLNSKEMKEAIKI